MRLKEIFFDMNINLPHYCVFDSKKSLVYYYLDISRPLRHDNFFVDPMTPINIKRIFQLPVYASLTNGTLRANLTLVAII